MSFADSYTKFRFKSFHFTHQTICDKFEEIINAGIKIDQVPLRITASKTLRKKWEPGLYERHILEYSLESHKLMKDFIFEQSAAAIQFIIDFRCHLKDSHLLDPNSENSSNPQFFDYAVYFEKSLKNPSGTVEMHLHGIQLDGQALDLVRELYNKEILFSHYQKSFDELLQHSTYAYKLMKEWMHTLDAEECWGGGISNSCWYEPEIDGFHYTDCDFRYTRNGPQLIEISMERQTVYSFKETYELLYKEFPHVRALENESSWSINRRLTRLIDLSWNDYYEMMKQGEMPPLGLANKDELYYSYEDSKFPDVLKRQIQYRDFKKDVERGQYNFDDGFMTVD